MNVLMTDLYDLGNSEYTHYKEMCALSTRSYLDNLQDIDCHIVLTGTYANEHEMFRQRFWRVYEIWKTLKCNLLVVDIDTLCIRPTRLFGQFREMRMFSLSDRKVYKDCNPGHPMFVGGVVYLPAAMPGAVWEMACGLARDWKNDWPYIQWIANKMFYAGIDEDRLRSYILPQFNFNMPWTEHGTLPIEDAHILHFHGSRGAAQAYAAMCRHWQPA
jgi:hypothetical protein